jgi:hypothetical protein
VPGQPADLAPPGGEARRDRIHRHWARRLRRALCDGLGGQQCRAPASPSAIGGAPAAQLRDFANLPGLLKVGNGLMPDVVTECLELVRARLASVSEADHHVRRLGFTVPGRARAGWRYGFVVGADLRAGMGAGRGRSREGRLVERDGNRRRCATAEARRAGRARYFRVAYGTESTFGSVSAGASELHLADLALVLAPRRGRAGPSVVKPFSVCWRRERLGVGQRAACVPFVRSRAGLMEGNGCASPPQLRR